MDEYKLIFDKCIQIIRDYLHPEYDSIYRMDMIEWLEDGKSTPWNFTCKGMYWDKDDDESENDKN